MPAKKLISIVIPVFNEQENIEPLHDALVPVLASLEDVYDFEILFTDNHSTDQTFQVIRRLAAEDRRIRALRFSRNFGFQRSILTGYNHARGDAAIQMDCDLQDPPALISAFLNKWKEGYQVVYGERTSRKESWWSTATRKFFYRLIDLLSEDPLPLDAGDFRLVDRCVLNELKSVNDDQPYLRGTIATLGFNQIGIPYDRAERQRGQSKFTLRQLFGLALDGILNHSIVPLRVATYIGLFVALCTFGAVIFYTAGRLFFGRTWPAGFATITVLLLGSLSLNALFLGVIGEYIGRIYRHMKNGSLTVIQDEIDPAGEPHLAESPIGTAAAPKFHRNR
jgi:glycosyltransferase involved in cell wall biosynthesis